jgi:hypothetical protein
MPKNLEITYWIPRRYAHVISPDGFRAAVAGTPEEEGVTLVLDALDRGEGLNLTGASILRYAASVHAPGSFLCSDEEHQVDSGRYADWQVGLTDDDPEGD